MISEALREMAWFKARIALAAAGVVVAIAVVAQLLWQTGNLPATRANQRSANQTAAPTSGTSPVVRVWIADEEHAPKVIDWHRYEFNRRPAEYLVRLEHGLILAGVVQDESGQPVSGARLQTTGPGSFFSSRENISYHPDLSQVITDTAGGWFFRQAPVG